MGWDGILGIFFVKFSANRVTVLGFFWPITVPLFYKSFPQPLANTLILNVIEQQHAEIFKFRAASLFHLVSYLKLAE